MSSVMRREKQSSFRVRTSMQRKWQRSEEVALIVFIKQNRDFEKPCAREYYSKFLLENAIDVDWKLVRCKVRNMRTAYRKAKEQEFNKVESTNCNFESARNQILKTCWYVDDFDILFPNELDIYDNNCSDPIFNDEFYNDASFSNVDKPSRTFKNKFVHEEESTTSSFSKSIGGENVFQNIKLKQIGQIPCRNRSDPVRKWQRNEEDAIIGFLKQNRDFEKPTARLYYTRFILESGIDIDWKRVRGKVRNMRTSYRRAKEHEINNAESNNCSSRVLRKKILKICWYIDDFDIVFPNEMDYYITKYSDPMFDDEFSKDAPFSNVDNSNKTSKNNFFSEEESTTSSFPKSIDGDVTEKEKRDGNTNIRQHEPEMFKMKLKCENDNFRQEIRLKEIESEQIPFRNRPTYVRKWQRNEEVAIIVFLKQYRDFEKPTARIYYTKFIDESGIHTDWKRVRSKVRNMRIAYRKAKEHEVNNAESDNYNVSALRNQILKICWYVDDFDVLFPNEMDNSKRPDPILDNEFSNDESFYNVDNSSKNLNNNFLLEEDSTTCSFSKSVNEDIFTAQTNLFKLKKQERDMQSSIKQQEIELAKEKLNFEKDKFRQEIRLKEKEIEIEERLKVMEFQMKERIAIKELEIEEKLALR